MRALIVLFANLAATTTFAQALLPEAGFVRVRPERELYVEFSAPRPGFPTIILLNGLTYSTKQYDAYARALRSRGIGVVRFDFDGMGRTLLRYAPSTAPYPLDQQIRDLKSLLRAGGLRPPYHFAGLSYGGGVALAYAAVFPQDIKSLVLMAPYTEPLEGQDLWIRGQIWATRQTYPNHPASDDELYDFFLRQIVYATYPKVEPIVLENPFKLEAVYNLARGIRKFRASDIVRRLPPGSVHLMTAVSDQYVPAPVLEKFWQQVPSSARMSRISVYQVEHKIPEVAPDFAAAWTWQILKGNPLLRGGRDFEGWALTGTVRVKNGQPIQIKE